MTVPDPLGLRGAGAEGLRSEVVTKRFRGTVARGWGWQYRDGVIVLLLLGCALLVFGFVVHRYVDLPYGTPKSARRHYEDRIKR
ncbi:MAG: hypothetical protein JWO68_1344 [Actinomycetia bacterium]|nr:hypothetical protein [Actinomycetes bacterium]